MFGKETRSILDAYRHYGSPKRLRGQGFRVARWFFIDALLRREKLDGCLAIDSDVPLWGDLSTERQRFGGVDMTYATWDEHRFVLIATSSAASRWPIFAVTSYRSITVRMGWLD